MRRSLELAWAQTFDDLEGDVMWLSYHMVAHLSVRSSYLPSPSSGPTSLFSIKHPLKLAQSRNLIIEHARDGQSKPDDFSRETSFSYTFG